MSTQPQTVLVTPEEYLEFERAAKEKHEYFEGQIIAMAGGSPVHSLVTMNVGRALGNALEGRPCQVLGPDLRVCANRKESYTYPDVVVACPPFEFSDDREDTLMNPIAVVEVLSPSTTSYDSGPKLRYYARIPSLREHLLIDPEPVHVEHGWRLPNGHWEVEVLLERSGLIRMHSLDAEVAIKKIYAGTEEWLKKAE